MSVWLSAFPLSMGWVISDTTFSPALSFPVWPRTGLRSREIRPANGPRHTPMTLAGELLAKKLQERPFRQRSKWIPTAESEPQVIRVMSISMWVIPHLTGRQMRLPNSAQQVALSRLPKTHPLLPIAGAPPRITRAIRFCIASNGLKTAYPKETGKTM